MGLEQCKRRQVTVPAVISLTSNAIYSVANPDLRPSRALHVYGGDLANPTRSIWNPVSMESEPFELPAVARYERNLAMVARTQTLILPIEIE